MAMFLVCHRHEPGECRFAYAAWKGFDSPLRHGRATASCANGGHSLWWTIDAENAEGALALLPPYVAQRAEAVPVSEVPIP